MRAATDAWQGLWRTTAWQLTALSYFLSPAIYANKKDYYEILKQTTKLENNLNFDFTAWIKWHLEAVNSAIKQAISSLKR
ncbi:hypothetical protein [Campylobacter concisus]|uniref:hypothetical protein n=1 Tax=Campylobacter concisus TaxID=199 RepID=UPI00215629F3|nr:hypothetical protein [Campylobacter concisus]